MVTISPPEPAKSAELTGLACPHCRERVPRVKLRKGSVISGLNIKCKRCGKPFDVKTE